MITDPQTGEIRGFREVEVADTTATATNSTSLVRAPGSLDDFARGSSQNLPFKPGGLNDDSQQAYETRVASLQTAAAFDPQALRRIPPGLDRGLSFDAKTGAKVQPSGDAKAEVSSAATTERKSLFHVSANSLIAKYAKDVDIGEVLERMRRREGRRGGETNRGAGRGLFEPGDEDEAFSLSTKPAVCC